MIGNIAWEVTNKEYKLPYVYMLEVIVHIQNCGFFIGQFINAHILNFLGPVFLSILKELKKAPYFAYAVFPSFTSVFISTSLLLSFIVC